MPALLTLFFGCCILLLGWGMYRPGRVYQYPFVAGAVFTGFVLPQLIGLRNDASLPAGAIDSLVVMSLLCMGCCYLGHAAARTPIRCLVWQLDEPKLVIVACFLSLLGACFSYKLGKLDVNVLHRHWTGLPVAYNFFAHTLFYGMAIAAFLWFRSRSRLALAILAFDAAFCFHRVFIAARRGDSARIALLILLAWWFQSRKAPPRAFFLAAILVGTVFVSSTGEYRLAQQAQTGRVSDIAFAENFRRVLKNGGAELRNAAFEISAAEREWMYDYGLFNWNTLVFNFVPRQLVGSEVKQTLTIDVPSPALQVYGYRFPFGTTTTGIADAFVSFSYVGCLKFFLIAFMLARVHKTASAGHTVAQLVYPFALGTGIESITHHTQWFFSAWVNMALLFLPTLYWARLHRSKANVHLNVARRVPARNPRRQELYTEAQGDMSSARSNSD